MGKLKNVGECLWLDEASGIYQAIVKRNGKQIKKSLGVQDRKTADRKLRDFLSDVEGLSENPADRRIKFAPLAARWLEFANTGRKAKTAKRNGVCVKKLNEYFGKKIVASISKLDCERWAAVRLPQVCPRSYNYDLQALKRIMKYAVEAGVTLKSPVEDFKKQREVTKEKVLPTKEQFELLLEILEARSKRNPRARFATELVQLLAYSGMRLGEATNLLWKDINFERATFTVTGGEDGTKSGKIRIVPIFPNLRSFLEDLRKKRIEIDGKPCEPTEKVLMSKDARTAMDGACKEADLPHFDNHCMRHYFTTNAVEAGIDFKTIGAWLGHRDGTLVARLYGHLRDTHSHEMAKRMV